MKNLTLILFFALLMSCQTKAQNENSNMIQVQNSNNVPVVKNVNEVNEVNEAKTSVSPTNLVNKTNDINSKIGNIQSGEQSVCLKIQNSNLKVGDKIKIILMEIPQEVLEAEISEKSSCKQKGFGTLDMADITDYLLKSSDEKFLNRGFGIGIISSTEKVKIANGFASIDLNGDKKDEYFRVCTSMEGLHLTVWSGKPLIGKRIWHSYYGVGYDTVPSCKEKDYE